MSDFREYSPLLFLGMALGVFWWFYCQEGDQPTYNKLTGVWSDIGFDPYAWWSVHGGGQDTYNHVYPSVVAANCLPGVKPNEEGALSTTELEVGGVWNG